MNRPQWRSVTGGSRAYVQAIAKAFSGRIRRGELVQSVRRTAAGVLVRGASGHEARYDQVVLATHADQALRLLSAPTPDERRLLGAFRYSQNVAVLHTDAAQMPRRRAAWSAWNHVGRRGRAGRVLRHLLDERTPGPAESAGLLRHPEPPEQSPTPPRCLAAFDYEHPLFDTASLDAQRQLWSLQGEGGVWFCGAHFGAGFHEDGLQSGLAVAEQLGGVRRPWTVERESGRIHVGPLRESADVVAA